MSALELSCYFDQRSMSLTYRMLSFSLTDALEEETLVHSREIGSYQQTFSYGVFPFGRRDKFTFKVHIFDIKGFITLEVCPDKLTWINFSKRSAF